jgi:hypothetical protein
MRPVTPFELPDLRRMVVSGRYFARRLSSGRIELVPSDPSAGLPTYAVEQVQQDERLDLSAWVQPRRRRRR